jgi:hypothetical protein
MAVLIANPYLHYPQGARLGTNAFCIQNTVQDLSQGPGCNALIEAIDWFQTRQNLRSCEANGYNI